MNESKQSVGNIGLNQKFDPGRLEILIGAVLRREFESTIATVMNVADVSIDVREYVMKYWIPYTLFRSLVHGEDIVGIINVFCGVLGDADAKLLEVANAIVGDNPSTPVPATMDFLLLSPSGQVRFRDMARIFLAYGCLWHTAMLGEAPDDAILDGLNAAGFRHDPNLIARWAEAIPQSGRAAIPHY